MRGTERGTAGMRAAYIWVRVASVDGRWADVQVSHNDNRPPLPQIVLPAALQGLRAAARGPQVSRVLGESSQTRRTNGRTRRAWPPRNASEVAMPAGLLRKARRRRRQPSCDVSCLCDAGSALHIACRLRNRKPNTNLTAEALAIPSDQPDKSAACRRAAAPRHLDLPRSALGRSS